MKNRLFICLILVMSALAVQAQLRVGLKIGLSTTDIQGEDLSILEPGGAQRFRLALEEAKYGIHGGVVIRWQINKFVLQPEVNFNSSSAEYQFDDLQNPSNSGIRTEKYQNLDIPLLLGVKFGPLRLQAGPVGHVFISSVSDLADVDGFKDRYESLTFGWQGGLGLDLWKFMLDLRYEGNFTKYGDHISFFGNDYNFDDRPARFLFSLGYLFGKQDKDR
ncbi:MAG: PorT family protein [Saprospiraceae bacterium]|nr:PorT family protein [Saprospiraceae bacterium]